MGPGGGLQAIMVQGSVYCGTILLGSCCPQELIFVDLLERIKSLGWKSIHESLSQAIQQCKKNYYVAWGGGQDMKLYPPGMDAVHACCPLSHSLLPNEVICY